MKPIVNNYILTLTRNSYIWVTLFGCIAGIYTEFVTLFVIVFWIGYYRHRWCKVSNLWIFIYSCLFFHGIFLSYILGYSHYKFFQQFVLLCMTYFSYNLIFDYCRVTPDKWFGIYLKVVYFIAIVGLIAFLIKYSINIDVFPYTLDGVPTQKTRRLHAFLAEAGSFVAFTTPAVAYVLLASDYFKKNKRNSVIILTAYILTQSASAMFSLLMILFIKIYRTFKYFRYILVISVLCALGWLATNYNQLSSSSDEDVNSGMGAVHIKFYETMSVLENASPYDFEHLNLSSYATLTNYWVAFNSPSRLLGTGLGTHAQNYEHAYKSSFHMYGLNKDDGYSLFVRLFSEFGLIGVCLYVFFLVKCYNKQNVMSLCLLVFFLSYMVFTTDYYSIFYR